MKIQLLFWCVFTISGFPLPAQNSSSYPVYLETATKFYFHLEPYRKKKTRGFTLRRDDSGGLFPAGETLLAVEKKKSLSEGVLYFKVIHPQLEEAVWIPGQSVSLTDDRLFFDLDYGDEKIRGYLICNKYHDDSGGSIHTLEFEDEVFGKMKLDLRESTKIIFQGKVVKIWMQSGEIYVGKAEVYFGNEVFVSEVFELILNPYGNEVPELVLQRVP